MKLFPIVFFLWAVAAGEVRDEMCNSQQTSTTKLIVRRTWPLTIPLPILFNCSTQRLDGFDNSCGNMCTKLTSTGTGVVQSPNFPGDYGNQSRFCLVTITAPAGWMIQLKFTTFNLETDKAYITVGDGTANVPRITGNTIPAVFPTTHNRLVRYFLVFKRSHFLDRAIGVLVSFPIQSPNYPGDYGNDYKYCVVSIIVPVGKRIQLTFTAFNLQTGHSSILVNYKDTVYMPRATGSKIPDVVTTDSNALYIQFYSDGDTTPHTAVYNWRATYTAVWH
ncbi:hypothetical protein DAPPUDRAFT_115638 [Daphnia pulex]|uniref:CUB domain-containing protein n=1 Tax=Daphnia pulex TaxID=6669 RepID=E9HM26_DAPPU|nr:hypothetical protein DAPPUDRAFT_115638 [Daphnia pulex]|eukprot:EFX67162.1 hypothetical protein DAPPUDRAFT_115638 [Daphnia pulex]